MATEKTNIKAYRDLDLNFRMEVLSASQFPCGASSFTKEDKIKILDSFTEKIKDKSSEVGMACKKFINAGFELNMQNETRDTLVKMLKAVREYGRDFKIEVKFNESDLADELMTMYSPDANIKAAIEKELIDAITNSNPVALEFIKKLSDAKDEKSFFDELNKSKDEDLTFKFNLRNIIFKALEAANIKEPEENNNDEKSDSDDKQNKNEPNDENNQKSSDDNDSMSIKDAAQVLENAVLGNLFEHLPA